MKQLFFLLAFLSMFFVANAQEPDVVYLNNGSVVRGEIVSENPGVSLKIRTSTGKEYEYRMTEIREIKKGLVIKPEKFNPPYRSYTELEKGYWTAVEFYGGISTWVGKENLGFLQLAWVNGYRFSEFFRLGVGIGGRYYFNNDSCRKSDVPWAFPIFLNVRGNIVSQRVDRLVPYWSMDVGTSIRDKFFFSPTLGLRFGGKRSDVLVGLSYTGQWLTSPEGNKYANLLGLKVGYEF